MSDLDVEALARTIWGEARSGGRAAMSHVASVVLNRVAVAQAHVLRSWRPHPLYGAGNAIGACLAPLQFSCWNAGDPNRPKLIAVSDADAMFGEAQTIARAAIDGRLSDETRGATHYHARSMAAPPGWAAGLTPTFVDGLHRFFRPE